MNKSKDLRNLFRESLINKRKYSSVTNYRYNGSNINLVKDVRIYFYEWSNCNKAPLSFYYLDLFENFLRTSGIFLQNYERDMILNIGTVYISCYHGTRNLCIRSSYKGLLDGMNEHDSKHLLSSVSKSSNVINFNINTSLPNDGTFFG